MPITEPGRFPIAGKAQAPEEAWSSPPVAPRGEGDLEVSGFARSCASAPRAELERGRRSDRGRGQGTAPRGPYGHLRGAATWPLRPPEGRSHVAPTALQFCRSIDAL